MGQTTCELVQDLFHREYHRLACTDEAKSICTTEALETLQPNFGAMIRWMDFSSGSLVTGGLGKIH